MNEDARCRMLLDLPEGFTEEQLRQAYRDMVKVWHPDRFGHDERLRQMAQEKLKDINGAYETLRAKLFEESISPHPEDAPESESVAPDEPDAQSRRSWMRTALSIVAIAALVGAGLYFFGKHPIVSGPSKQQQRTNDVAWEILYDGKNVDHWRGYRQDEFPGESWFFQGGTLRSIEGAPAVDLITREEYQDFDLQLEWCISPGGNSGIMFHVSEGGEKPWMSGPEMQIIDDDRHPDRGNPKTSAGSLFGVIAPKNNHTNPAGEWNQTRILVSGPHVEYWINGEKVVEYELGSDAFKAQVADSQFRDQRNYAQEKTGRIVLQSYERQISFRNIKIRRLTPPHAEEKQRIDTNKHE